jgi:hypothetical protein
MCCGMDGCIGGLSIQRLGGMDSEGKHAVMMRAVVWCLASVR